MEEVWSRSHSTGLNCPCRPASLHRPASSPSVDQLQYTEIRRCVEGRALFEPLQAQYSWDAIDHSQLGSRVYPFLTLHRLYDHGTICCPRSRLPFSLCWGQKLGGTRGLGLDIEMLKLWLERHAWYWEIGSLLLSCYSLSYQTVLGKSTLTFDFDDDLDVVQICSKLSVQRFSTLDPEGKCSVRRFPMMAPNWLRCEMMS